jgi:hypothetical protein
MYIGIPIELIHSVNKFNPIAPKHMATKRTQAASTCHAKIPTSFTESKDASRHARGIDCQNHQNQYVAKKLATFSGLHPEQFYHTEYKHETPAR